MTSLVDSIAGTRPWVWGLVFTLGALVVAALQRSGMVAPPWTWLMMFALALTLLPMVRAVTNRQRACGSLSPAMQRYNRRSLHWALGYFVAIFIAVVAHRQLETGNPLLYAVAVLPALPILYLVWAMGRYFAEETDEYQKMRQVQSALAGLGALLAVASVAGFLQTFAGVAMVPAWWAVPVWAVGMGLYQAARGIAERTKAGE